MCTLPPPQPTQSASVWAQGRPKLTKKPHLKMWIFLKLGGEPEKINLKHLCHDTTHWALGLSLGLYQKRLAVRASFYPVPRPRKPSTVQA